MAVVDELRRRRATTINEARGILDVAEAEKRELTAEEEKRYDDLIADQERQQKNIDRLDRQAKLESDLTQPVDPEHRAIRPNPGDGGGTGSQEDARSAARLTGPAEVRDRFGRAHRELRFWLPDGNATRTEQEIAKQTALRRYLLGGPMAIGDAERRALQLDDPTLGGYTTPPLEFMAQLIKFVDDAVYVRQYATVIPVTTSDSIGIPSLDADPADADWTSELATGSEDSTMAFGRRELHPWPLAKRIKVSNRLLRVSALPIESLVTQRLGYKFAISEEKAFLTGSGAGRPLGLFTASADGISTARDVSTGNTTTAITADGLIEALYSVKSQYQASGHWLFHRDGVKQIMKLKDGTGEYLWRMGEGMDLTGARPDTLLNRPLSMSEYVPNTFTTGLYVGLFGDLSFYWIADALTFQIQRLVELYAETNQVGFIGRLECDGMPVLEEAFARVKLA